MFTELHQNDPRWENNKLGFSNSITIRQCGCLLTSAAIIVNFYGGNETPASLNDKMKGIGGFQDAWIKLWKLVELYPNLKYQKRVECADQPAPIKMIDESLKNNRPVIVQVDSSPVPGVQGH